MNKDCTKCVNFNKYHEAVVLPANCGTQMQEKWECTLLKKRIWCKYQTVCENYKED